MMQQQLGAQQNTPPSGADFMSTKRVDQPQQQPQQGLIQFLPSDLHRDYPHIARGSYGIVFKVLFFEYNGLTGFLGNM